MANVPAPTKVICAREIWPDHPVSGTNDSMMSAVQIARSRFRMFSRSNNDARTKTTTRSAAIPNAARRRVGTRALTVRVVRLPSVRASGMKSNAMNSTIVGIAGAAAVQRPPQLRKFCWNEIDRPMMSPPT